MQNKHNKTNELTQLTAPPLDMSMIWGIYPPALSQLMQLQNGRHVPGEWQQDLLRNRMAQSAYPVNGGVAIININGAMSKYADYWTAIYGGAVHTELEAAVKAAAGDPNVQAILLRIDSPGGTVAGVSDLADAVFKARSIKPVVAYVSDLAASCGYYIASQAEHIYSDSDALIGCIGTINVIYDLSEAFKAEGIEANVFASQEDACKGTGVMGAKLTDEQREYVQQMVDDLGDKFIEDIYRGRPSLKGGMELPDGRVHIAAKAKAMGLIDDIRSFDDVLAELQQKGKSEGKNTKADYSTPETGAQGNIDSLDMLSRKLELEAAEM